LTSLKYIFVVPNIKNSECLIIKNKVLLMNHMVYEKLGKPKTFLNIDVSLDKEKYRKTMLNIMGSVISTNLGCIQWPEVIIPLNTIMCE
jgi:hypothetical protein